MTLKQKIFSRMALLEIEPKRSLGQNFLISDSVVEKIIKAADPKSFDHVFEIGPGLGALTDLLIVDSKKLTLIELDKKFSAYWKDQSITVEEVDALKFPWSNILWSSGKHLLVSNLPYQISSRLTIDLSLQESSFDRMVLMFQKEVAQRIIAEPSTAQYGLLSVVVQIFWNVHTLLEAGAVDFMPKPKVASRVLVFNRKKINQPLLYSKAFLNFIKLCFENRRKKLLPKLQHFKSKSELIEVFNNLGLSEDVRAEKLEPEQFIELYTILKKE
jgi:16S rRNA (adenine1518-N6/adenine1519-N6)-dimethyltransferase